MAFIKVENLFGKVKVQIVTENPDLFVYVTKSSLEAGGKDECWYYVELGHDLTITFVEKNPDIKIQFVDKKEDARWVNKNHKLYKRLIRA
ncbi:MAG: hypothetical protein KatS3mg035_1850 [Bacteroidia bacterium]|nr:MAG: hypothetical protein KatS3mg035_1850 [Bacteroidia bacterium]